MRPGDGDSFAVRYARRVLAIWADAEPPLLMYGGLARRNLEFVRGPFVDAAVDEGWDVDWYADCRGTGVEHVVALAGAVVAHADTRR